MTETKSITFTEFGLKTKIKDLKFDIETYLKNNNLNLESDIPITHRKHFDELLYQLEKLEKIYGEKYANRQD